MLGAIIGDIVGSRFEWNNYRAKDFEFLTYKCFFTDDSVMSLAVAKAILNSKKDHSDLSANAIRYMQEIGRPYPDCGYGGSFYDWIYAKDPKPYNSFGNGAAMRVSACGFAAKDITDAKIMSNRVTRISHNHPEGLKGAEATAVAIVLAKEGKNILEIRDYMSRVHLGDVAIEHKETCKEDKSMYPIVGLEHLTPEQITLQNWDLNTENTFTKVFRKGNILFGRRRAYLKKAAVAPFDGICSGDITVIEAKEDKIIPELLPFVIQNDDLFDFAVGKSAGSLSPRVKWTHLQNYEFELPTKEKQRELAKVLWAIEDTRKSYQELIKRTDELVKSQFIEMFVGKYPMISLGDEIKTTSGGTPSKKKEEYYLNGNIPWLTSGEVNLGYVDSTQNFITQAGLDNSSAKWVPENSVVIAMYGATAGKVGVIRIPVTTNQAICTLLPNPEFETLYLYHACKNKEKWMLSKCAGAAQPNISQTVIKEMQIEKPPVEVQKQFVEFIEQSDKSKFELNRALDELTATYKQIIKDNLG